MTHENRNECIQKHFDEIMKIAHQKGHEYANSDEDANKNFSAISENLGMDQKQVLWVYTAKHIRSIEQFLRTGRQYSNENIEGRIHDTILYLFILLSIIEDEGGVKIHKDDIPF